MSLRLKIVLLLSVLAASATAAIGVVSYRTTARELRHTVDDSLQVAADRLLRAPNMPDQDRDGDGGGDRDGDRADRPRGAVFEQVRWQLVDGTGTILVASSQDVIDVTALDLDVANDVRADTFRTERADRTTYRVLTVPFAEGALMLSRSLDESNAVVAAILHRTLVWMLVVVAVTMVGGWLLARQVTRRLEHLSATAQTVATTGRLDVPVPVDGNDETGRLGRAFSGMLDALSRSRQAQRQLVQDAGHELRTPLTSLRTNVSVLRRNLDALSPEQRAALLDDLDSETRELTDLVNELVELATEQRDDEPVQHVMLADVVERVAARARRRTGRDIVTTVDDSSVQGRPGAVERAVQNLVDNACKFAPSGPIEVTLSTGTVTVRDHGPGLDEADIPHLFDRFYRAVGTRSLPGSGLGLSIVRSVAEAHGGTAFARNAADGAGGAEIGLTIRNVPPQPSAG
ncbi:MAG: ATP-binding protein [Ilumatobacteraceae bacterium]